MDTFFVRLVIHSLLVLSLTVCPLCKWRSAVVDSQCGIYMSIITVISSQETGMKLCAIPNFDQDTDLCRR